MALSRIKTWIAEILYAADLNAEFNNILNNALSLISPLTGNLDAGANRLTNVGAPTALTDAFRLTDHIHNTGVYYTTAGTQPNYTLTPSPAITAYAAGQQFLIKLHSAQTSDSPTINISAVGAKNIYSADGQALKAYSLQQDSLLWIAYDGTQFRVLSPLLTPSELVEVKTVSGAATMQFTLPSGYSYARFSGADIVPATQDAVLWARIAIASVVKSDGVYVNEVYGPSGANVAATLTTTDTSMILAGATDNNGPIGLRFGMDLYNWSGTSLYKVAEYSSFAFNNGGTQLPRNGWAYYPNSAAITDVQFLMSSGNWTGTIAARYKRIA